MKPYEVLLDEIKHQETHLNAYAKLQRAIFIKEKDKGYQKMIDALLTNESQLMHNILIRSLFEYNKKLASTYDINGNLKKSAELILRLFELNSSDKIDLLNKKYLHNFIFSLLNQKKYKKLKKYGFEILIKYMTSIIKLGPIPEVIVELI